LFDLVLELKLAILKHVHVLVAVFIKWPLLYRTDKLGRNIFELIMFEYDMYNSLEHFLALFYHLLWHLFIFEENYLKIIHFEMWNKLDRKCLLKSSFDLLKLAFFFQKPKNQGSIQLKNSCYTLSYRPPRISRIIWMALSISNLDRKSLSCTIVNFINNICANFLYESRFGSFSLVTCT